jgi:hypothetical protein
LVAGKRSSCRTTIITIIVAMSRNKLTPMNCWQSVYKPKRIRATHSNVRRLGQREDLATPVNSIKATSLSSSIKVSRRKAIKEDLDKEDPIKVGHRKEDRHQAIREDRHRAIKDGRHQAIREDRHRVIREDRHRIIREDRHRVIREDLHRAIKEAHHRKAIIKEGHHHMANSSIREGLSPNSKALLKPKPRLTTQEAHRQQHSTHI